MQWFFIGIAATAGMLIAIQAAANGSLRETLGSAWYAAFFSIAGTMASAVIFILSARTPLPTLGLIRTAPWWNWIGGPLGAAFVLSGTLLVPRLGTATFLAAVIAGQLTCSLAIDHFGLMHIQQHSLTLGRTMGAALIFGGVLAIKYF